MKTAFHKHQTGAALIVALILLVALSLMAISSMNTASLDLIMAGNEQYRSRAFFAAEAGIQRALIGGTFNTSADFTQAATPVSTATADSNTTFGYTITRPSNGVVEQPPPGFSEGEGQFGTVYFRITSTGTADRGSRVQNVQELYQVVKSGDSTTCMTSLTSCVL